MWKYWTRRHLLSLWELMGYICKEKFLITLIKYSIIQFLKLKNIHKFLIFRRATKGLRAFLISFKVFRMNLCCFWHYCLRKFNLEWRRIFSLPVISPAHKKLNFYIQNFHTSHQPETFRWELSESIVFYLMQEGSVSW